MNPEILPEQGRKRPLRDVAVARLHLDRRNPRLPEEVQGKQELELLSALYKDFYLEELADSMAKNAYFDEEPLVSIPKGLPGNLRRQGLNEEQFLAYIDNPTTEFTVVEGNRRLAAAKILLSAQLRQSLGIKHWPTLSADVKHDLSELPTIIYRTRDEVVPYLGIRHIVGIQKWEPYAKARYVAALVDGGARLDDVVTRIGDSKGTVKKNYLAYKLLEQAKDEFDFDTRPAKRYFSYLLLSLGQGKIKRFLGLPIRTDEPTSRVPNDKKHLGALRDLLSWLYGDGQTAPVIKDSRDITNFLSPVVESSDALAYLRRVRDLQGAYDRSDGEEQLLLKYLTGANSKLEGALGIAHRHVVPAVIDEINKCAETTERLRVAIRRRE